MKYKAKILVTVEFEFDSELDSTNPAECDAFLADYNAHIDSFIINVEGPELDYNVSFVDTVEIGKADEHQE